jgi:hypothetical protein
MANYKNEKDMGKMTHPSAKHEETMPKAGKAEAGVKHEETAKKAGAAEWGEETTKKGSSESEHSPKKHEMKK